MSSESSESIPPQDVKFDHEAISIEATEIQPNCFKIEFEVPSEQVLHFIKQLRAVKPDIKPQETATLLITTCLEEANARLDRHRFFEPRIAEGCDPPVLHPEKPFRATFIQDGFLMPDWPDFSLLNLSLPDLEVTDELVEQELQDQRLDAGSRADLTDPVAPMDEVLVDATIRLRGHEKPMMEMTKSTARVSGPGQKINLGGIVIDGGDALIGKSVGSTTIFPSRLPDNLQNTDFRGRDIDVELRIASASRITPATEEQVAERFGTPNVEVLKMQIRFALENRMNEHRRNEANSQLLPQLRQLCPIEIPDRVVDQIVAQQMPEIIERARKDGMEEDGLRKLAEEQKPQLRTQAETRAQRLVLMRLLNLHFKVSVTEEELLEQIRHEAAKMNRRPEDLRKEIIESGNISAVGDRVRELKVFDQLARMATTL